MPKTKKSENDSVNGEGPEFDFDNLTWRDQRKASILQITIQKALQDLDVAAAEQAMDDLESFYAQVVASVPPDWVHKDAPANLDWSDRESYGWLRDGKFEELGAAMAATREARSKN